MYDFGPDGAFIIHDYHHSKPFSSFLPGIAGLWGIPLWCYYVNRGQAVACFGTRDKNHAMMEFKSANLHHREVALDGFRTFIKVRRNGKVSFYEPFRAENPHHEVRNTLTIGPSSLRLEETNTTLGLDVTVEYFTLPGEPFAALARTVSIRNTSAQPMELEVLDGFPKWVPFGEAAHFLKVMPFITEAYMELSNVEGRIPLNRMKAKPSDSAETEFVTGGNFYFGFEDGRPGLLAPIVDPGLIFGDFLDFIRPYAFQQSWEFGAGVTKPQAMRCQTACAFVHWPFTLAPGETRTLRSLFGHARDLADAQALPARVMASGYFPAKQREALAEVEKIKQRFFIHSASPELNQYLPATFLDNVLRGGLPLTLKAGQKHHIFHVYSRRHGDLERDYNFFSLAPTYFSQGNGAFRDVNQNRRNDVWFNPDVEAENVRAFFNLIQPDGYNPMLVRGASFAVSDGKALAALLGRAASADDRPALSDFLAKAYAPGDLFAFLEDRGVKLAVPPAQFLEELLAISQKIEEAEYESGYWCDHWIYNFDLLESFLAIYPERAREVLIDRRDLTYWDPSIRVVPRDEKYVALPDGRIRHIGSVEEDKDKARLIAARSDRKHMARTASGQGEIYTTNLLGKIVCLLANKAATIAPSGLGIDMDGGRPGWLDSINGIPGLFAASTCEMFQLVRAIRLVTDSLAGLADDYEQPLPREVHELVRAVWASAREYLDAGETAQIDRDYRYWDQTNTAKEAYRVAVRFGFDGAEARITWAEIREFFAAIQARVEASLPRAVDPATGLPITYVTHEPAEYQQLPQRNARGLRCVRVAKFKPHSFPLFLEAPMHAMNLEADADKARDLWQTLRQSPLYDQKLRMYLTTDSVANESRDLGRIWAWPAGWFENENIFLHMEHKYLLAMLRAGLHDEFFEDMRACLIPFQNVETYGRNPLENASFIASSRHPRPAYHGRGFLPRSSGTTAEILNMFLWMSFGRKPFRVDEGKLTLRFEPVLAEWMFTRKEEVRELTGADGTATSHRLPADSYTALFLGHTLVTYLNPSRRNTFGPAGATVKEYRLFYRDGREPSIAGDVIAEPITLDVREGRVGRIVVTLG